MKKLLFLFLIPLFCISCHKDCYTSPEPVIFQFVNSSGENLIQNGTLNTNYAIQEDAGNGNYIGVQLTKTADHKLILEKVGSFDGIKKYKFFSDVEMFNFSIQSSKATDGCDGFTINHINFENITATKENGYYKIILQ